MERQKVIRGELWPMRHLAAMAATLPAGMRRGLLTGLFFCMILTDMSVSKRNKEATEAAIIEAAVATFRRDGYAKARVSDIVGKCGLSQGAFYLYFRSKEQVLRRIMHDFMEEINSVLDDVTTIFGGDRGEDVLLSFTKFLEKILRVHQRNLGVAEIIWREGFGHGGLFAKLFTEIYAYFLEIVRERMDEAVAKGLIHSENTEVAAVFLVSMFERSSFYFMVIRGDTKIHELAAGMARFMLYGLLPDLKRQHAN